MSLTALRDDLLEKLGPAQFSLLNTRLTLSVGVNLKDVTPADDRDPAVIARVTRALADMGVPA